MASLKISLNPVFKLDNLMSAGLDPDDFALMRELLSRDPATLSSSLRTSMWEASKAQRYEEAAIYVDLYEFMWIHISFC